MMKPARTLLGLALLFAIAGGLFALPGLRAALALPSLPSLYSSIVADGGSTLVQGVPYGPLGRNLLDVYRPASGDRSGPIVLFLYGGGWRSGERSTYGFVGAALAARGITTVIPDYRLFPEVRFPSFVEDAARAYAWVDATLASAPGGRRPIVVIGHSAGAHIAALLALDTRYLGAAGPDLARPAGFVGLAGPYAFDATTYPSTAEIFTPAVGSQDARPLSFVSERAPPALLLHGTKDETVGLWNTRALAEALQARGRDARKIELEGIGHAGLVLAISRPLRWRAPVLREIVAFVTAVAAK
ncbi:MAG: alpha/beta hydrolase [Hyphomicrobiaceae bacterium]|nr:MAG: alpha/beta hydrolase [Hyphomicrobiaceae bacterium]